MREFHTHKPSARISRHRMLIATLAVLLVGGAAFAAVGGADGVKRFFVNVRIVMIGSDGTVHDTVVELEKIDGEEGTATATLDLGDGEQATLEIQEVNVSQLGGVDIDGGEEAAMVTISLSGLQADHADTKTERTIELMATLHTGDEPIEQTEVLEQIADAEIVVPWTDSDGDEREVYIVREEGEDGTSVVKLFGSRWTEDDEEVFDMLGIVMQLDSLIVDAPTIEIHKDRVTSVTVLCEDGQERTLRIGRNAKAKKSDPETVQIIIGSTEDESAVRERDWESEEE